MSGDREERNRVLGVPRGPGRAGSRSGQGEEQQYALGLPAEWLERVDGEWLRSLLHPVRGYQQWRQRRRLGFYVTDEDEPPPES